MPGEPSVLIAAATLESGDFDAIAAIERASFSEPGIAPEEELARPWARIFVARMGDAGSVAGFILVWFVADELHVLSIATAPAMRRHGIGRALLDHALAEARARHVRLVLLEVRRSNHAAIRLYRALGFSAMGVRPRYYADNLEDAIEMILVLDPVTGEIQPGRDEVRLEEDCR